MIKRPSLYDILLGNFSGGLPLHTVGENTQVILSVLDNMQRILNTRAGSLKHLPDYGLPDMTKILQGMPGTAHQLISTLSQVLLKYEPRLKGIQVTMQDRKRQGIYATPSMPNCRTLALFVMALILPPRGGCSYAT